LVERQLALCRETIDDVGESALVLRSGVAALLLLAERVCPDELLGRGLVFVAEALAQEAYRLNETLDDFAEKVAAEKPAS
jgi:hypothetical protein